MTSLRASLLALAAACAVLPAAAQADSISYIKDGDVWLSTPDGGRQFRVTATGGYSYASQADDGTLVALKGERLVKLSRMGDVLADFPTPVSDGPPPSVGPAANDTSANYFHGPYDPEVSPDGTKVAYTYYWQHYTYNYISGHMEQMLVSGTAITHADRLTAWDELGGNLTGWKDPAWVDDASLVRADAGVAMSDELVVNTLGAPEQGLVRWIKASPWLSTFKQPEVNRQATMVAAATKTGDGYATGHGLHLFRAEGGLGGSLTICHEVDDDAGGRVKMEHPTWAPSGDRLAFQAPEGIAVVTPPPCPTDGSIARVHDWSVVVPGATAPDWGPADVPASRPAA
ncbi:MAG: hypothetical protein HZB46_08195, partial [Solirubrobacterales bacterium]|nr:hypothetical protein [Solirubrobacterales bacterium]